MADQSNPPIPADMGDGSTTVGQTAGDPNAFSLDLPPAQPEAPAADGSSTDTNVSDLGDILMDQNLDAVQQKDAIAEPVAPIPTPDPTPLTEISLGDAAMPTPTPAPILEVIPTMTDAPAATQNTDSLQIDLGDITLSDAQLGATAAPTPAVPELAMPEVTMPSLSPSEDTAAMPAPATTTNDMFSGLGDIQLPTVEPLPAPAVITPEPMPTNAQDAPTISSSATIAPTNNFADIVLPSAPTKEANPFDNLLSNENQQLGAPAMNLSEAFASPTVAATNATTVAPTNTPAPSTVSSADILTMSTSPSAMPEIPMINTSSTPAMKTEAAPAMTAPQENIGLDLDTLTNTVNGSNVATSASLGSVNATALVSAPLPGTTPTAHASGKKKALVGILTTLVFVGVAFVVFKMEFPMSTNDLSANIVSPSITSWTTTNSGAQNATGTTQTDSGVAATSGVMLSGTTASSGSLSGDNTVGSTGMNGTGTDMSGGAMMLSGGVSPISLTQAESQLTSLISDSKKALVTMLKSDDKNDSAAVYKIFKNSSTLLETLESGGDITTIPGIGQMSVSDYIQQLQQNLQDLQSSPTYGANLNQP